MAIIKKKDEDATQAQQNLQQHQAMRPGPYQSQYQKPMQGLLGQIVNRGPFQWNPDGDALYQQAVDQYIQQGKQAMADTVGQVSALTGGYGNSYAQTAGQQTYQGYLQKIGGLAGQYQQMAMDRYRLEGDDLKDRYGALADAEGQEYGRYNDNLNRWLAEQDRLQGLANREEDMAIDQSRYDQQWQHQLDREAAGDLQWQQQFDENNRRYNQEWEHRLELERKAEEDAKNRGRGGGGGGGGGGNPTAEKPQYQDGKVPLDITASLIASSVKPQFAGQKNRGPASGSGGGQMMTYDPAPASLATRKGPGGGGGGAVYNAPTASLYQQFASAGASTAELRAFLDDEVASGRISRAEADKIARGG